MKYRIKESQFFDYFGLSSSCQPSVYRVQAKAKWFPLWATVTRRFNTLSQAKSYIELILDEKDQL